MYDRILVTLDTTPTDRAIIDHVLKLARLVGARVMLLHVATGAPAQWRGRDAGGEEIEQDTMYLDRIKREFINGGIDCDGDLLFGEPAAEIVRWIEREPVDLIAMSTHGHRVIGDLLYGTTAMRVQHRVSVPVLLLRAANG